MHIPTNPSKKRITGLTDWGFQLTFKISQLLTSLLPSLQTSPPASDSDQTTFPQGRVYQETFLTSLIG
jgi:hypothetical protein